MAVPPRNDSPGSAPRSDPAAGVCAPEPTLLHGKRAVIVEDEGLTLMQLRRILQSAGMLVVGKAVTGEEGVVVCLRERPDLVLMDITLPGEIDGLEATRRILAQVRTCVVIVTAYSTYEEQTRHMGACGYMVKPVTSDTLLPQLRQAFGHFYSGQQRPAKQP